MTRVFDELADFAVGVEYESIPPLVRSAAKDAILDTIGVALAAVDEPIAPVLRELSIANGAVAAGRGAARPGGSTNSALQLATLIGLALKAPPSVAAWVNGSLAHALDFDDISDTMGGHPSVPMLPAALAVAETLGSSGRDLITAYVVGHEVETKIAKGLNFAHYERGWHPTSTLGIFGAAAATAKLQNLSRPEVVRSLAIASSMSSGIKGNFGTMTKAFQVGQAAQRGLIATQAASAGLTTNEEAFVNSQGFAEVYNGPGQYDLDAIIDTLGSPWDLEDPGLVVKQYPCCGSTHPAVEAALGIRGEHDFGVADVQEIQIWLHPRRLKHTNRASPKSALECKFSVQYAVSVAIAENSVRLRHFSDDHPVPADVNRLLSATTAKPLPEERWGPEHFAGEVVVHLKDGRRLFRRVEKAKGRGTKLALTPEEIDAKFTDCATRSLALDSAQALLSQLRSLEEQNDIARLVTKLASVDRGAGQPQP